MTLSPFNFILTFLLSLLPMIIYCWESEIVHEKMYEFDSIIKSPILDCSNGIALVKNSSTILISMAGASVAKIQNDEISQFLGTTAGSSGTRIFTPGIGLNMKISVSQGIVVGKNNLIYVCEFNYHVILMVTLNGETTVLAGNPDLNGHKDGPFSEARFFYPHSLALSNDKNTLYLGEGSRGEGFGNNMIRALDLNSKVVVSIAGQPAKSGYKDGPANQTLLKYPYAIAVHPITGDLYIADSLNHAIRVYSISQKLVETVAGTGEFGFSDGNLNETIFDEPVGLAFQKDGTLFVSDRYNHRIRKIDLIQGKTTTFVGSESAGYFDGLGKDAQLKLPYALAIDEEEDILYVSDCGNYALRKVSLKSSLTTTYAASSKMGSSDGIGSKAMFGEPCSLALNDKGGLFVTDRVYKNIRMINTTTFESKTVAGATYSGFNDGPTGISLFTDPYGITRAFGSILITDSSGFRIRSMNDSFYVKTLAGNGISGNMNGESTNATFYTPKYVDFDNAGNIYVSDFNNHIIRMISTDGMVSTLAGTGQYTHRDGTFLNASFRGPLGLTVNRKESIIYVIDYFSNYLRKLDLKSKKVSTIAGYGWSGYKDGPGIRARFCFPFQITLGSDQNIYVADNCNEVIRKVSPDGLVSTVFPRNSGFRDGLIGNAQSGAISAVAFDPLHKDDSVVYYGEEGNKAIRKVMFKENRIITIAGYGASIYVPSQTIDDNVKAPQGIAIDMEAGDLYFCNTDRNVISKISYLRTKDNPTILAGQGGKGWFDSVGRDAQFNEPQGIAFLVLNETEKCLLVADTENHVIRKIDLKSKIVKTIAGTGYPGYRNGIALKSMFAYPTSIVFDSKLSVIYISDMVNNVIRKMTLSTGKVQTVCGNGSLGFTNGIASNSTFNAPKGLALLFDGSLAIADSLNHCIRMWNNSENIVTTLSGIPSRAGVDSEHYDTPQSVAVDPSDPNIIYVIDYGNRAVRMFRLDSRVITTIFTGTEKQRFRDLVIGPIGELYATDMKRNAILRLVPTPKLSDPDLSGALPIFIVVAATIGAAIILAGLLFYRKHAKKETVIMIKRIKRIANKGPKLIGEGMTNTVSMTMSPDKSVAISIPGYLEININADLIFESSLLGKESREGGTAKVLPGTLTNQSFIDRSKTRNVAVKICYEKSNFLKADFLYEVAIMSTLPESDHICKFVGYSAEKLMVLVLKFYPKTMVELFDSVKDDERQKLVEKAALDMAKGLAQIHESNVIHLDIKPENVLVDVEITPLSSYTFVICDFGYANFTIDSGRQRVAGFKKAYSSGMTLRYAAPEVFSNTEDISRFDLQIHKKIDVYAYGMTLYWLITGQRAFSNVFGPDIATFVINGERPEFATSDQHQNLQNLAKKCWHQDPNQRPSFPAILSLMPKP